MKRCTLFLSTAGGSSPYGTFTNITTDQTSGISRQIWHTYLNEQQGSSGCLRLCRRKPLWKAYAAAPLLSKDTLYIYHSFHFCQGKQLICPRSTTTKKEVCGGGGGVFYSPKEINVPDKWGYCPLGTQNTNKYQIILIKTLPSVKLCTEFDNNVFFWQTNFLRLSNEEKIWHDCPINYFSRHY